MQGVIYGSRSSKDASSTVMYRPFDSWAANSDWQVSLPPGEEATAVTAGHSFSAVATSQHMLRIFSSAGANAEKKLYFCCHALLYMAQMGLMLCSRCPPPQMQVPDGTTEQLLPACTPF